MKREQFHCASPSSLPVGTAFVLSADTIEPLLLYHYPPHAACVLCGRIDAEHVAEVRGGCIPACATCLAARALVPVTVYARTHPAYRRALVILGPRAVCEPVA